MLGIVVSRADRASTHIAEHLFEVAAFEERTDSTRSDAAGGGTVYYTPEVELRTFDELHIRLENVEAAFSADIDVLVFASRHAGDTGALLSAHHMGNFGPAEFGGETGRFARAAPLAHKRVIETFAEVAPPEYEVATECTHHGPTDIDTPSLFCELGSDEAQWNDPAGARAVARAILSLRDVTFRDVGDGDFVGIDEPSDGPDDGSGDKRVLAGFGGGHYANRFLRIVQETDWAVGHVGAAWALSVMGSPADNDGVLRRAMERSGATHAVVDGREPGVESVLRDLGYRVVSETWVRETSGVPLDLVGALEDEVESIDEGLRFGDLATTGHGRTQEGRRGNGAIQEGRSGNEGTEGDDVFTVVSLPAALLRETQGIDLDRVREAVRSHTLAFDTNEGGTRLAGRVALRSSENRKAIVEALVEVVAAAYDEVSCEDDAIVARETVFDPEKARDLGVPEGPAFGSLAAGERVTVNGTEITPEAVHSERERRFPF